MSEMIPNQTPETKIVEIDHGGEKLYEYTYRNGAKHVYGLNAETGKKSHIGHDDVLAAQGYSLTPDETGSYLLPNHPDHSNSKAEEALATPTTESSMYSSGEGLEDDPFIIDFLNFKEETAKLNDKIESPKTAKLGDNNELGQNADGDVESDEFKKKFEDAYADKAPASEKAEKGYKARMRKLGHPLLKLWHKGGNIVNTTLNVEAKIEKPVRPRTEGEELLRIFEAGRPRNNKVAKQFHTFDADLAHSNAMKARKEEAKKVAEQFQMFDDDFDSFRAPAKPKTRPVPVKHDRKTA